MLSFKQFLLEGPRLQNIFHTGPLGTTPDDITAAKKFWRTHIRKPAAIAAITGALLLGLHGGKSMAPTPTVSTRPAPVATELIRNK